MELVKRTIFRIDVCMLGERRGSWGLQVTLPRHLSELSVCVARTGTSIAFPEVVIAPVSSWHSV